jgi:hypothetical protein
MTRPKRTVRALGSCGAARLAFAIVLAALAPSVALAGPRDDVKSSYATALSQFGNLDLDAAVVTLDSAIARAQAAGLGNDAALAPLLVLKGGIVFSNTGDKGQTIAAFKEAVRVDHNAQLPIELRSPELQALLEEARKLTPPTATDAIVHTPPAPVKGVDIELSALVNTPLPDNANVVLYWRKQGDKGEFKSVYMDLFGNSAAGKIAASEHGDSSIEYFFYAFDAGQKPLANRGDQDHPLVLAFSGDAGGGGGAVVVGGGGGGTTDKPKRKREPGKSGLPRAWIGLGIGTGFGIARGTAELTYQQYTPGIPGSVYGPREQACQLERWFAANAPVVGNGPDNPATPQLENGQFAGHLATMAMVGPGVLPTDAATLEQSYDAGYCGAHHPVSTGLASAPFHISPEVSVRVSRRIVLSLFSRLQVVTGSKVFREDPNKELAASFNEDVRSPDPSGTRVKPPFSWTIGAKFKYFFLKDEKKFRLFAGGLVGYGKARLRVDMGFSNDRNGNSVPDATEVGPSGPRDAMGNVIISSCTPVWPYNQACDPEADPAMPPEMDRNLARSVTASTPASDSRVDTVVIGPGFVGGLFGFNYQIHKYFAIFGEIDISVFFPNTSSALFDIQVGPAVTF